MLRKNTVWVAEVRSMCEDVFSSFLYTYWPLVFNVLLSNCFLSSLSEQQLHNTEIFYGFRIKFPAPEHTLS